MQRHQLFPLEPEPGPGPKEKPTIPLKGRPAEIVNTLQRTRASKEQELERLKK